MISAALLAFTVFQTPAAPPVVIRPAVFTQPVSEDADDPAIWINEREPGRSRIFATDKTAAPAGGIYVFDLNGRILQRITGVDRPNNIDVLVGFDLNGRKVDLAIATERYAKRLRVFRVDPATGLLRDVTGNTRVFANETGERSEPMGIATFRGQGGDYAIVSPKTGPAEGYLGWYRLSARADGRVDAMEVRRSGRYSGVKEIESLAVDPDSGLLIYSDETVGTRVAAADPADARFGQELASFNREGTLGDHEGIGVYRQPDGAGYWVLTDQIDGASRYRVFDRQSRQFLGHFTANADSTDGIDVTSRNLGPRFPEGILVAMDSGPKRFVIVDWRDVRKALRLP